MWVFKQALQLRGKRYPTSSKTSLLSNGVNLICFQALRELGSFLSFVHKLSYVMTGHESTMERADLPNTRPIWGLMLWVPETVRLNLFQCVSVKVIGHQILCMSVLFTFWGDRYDEWISFHWCCYLKVMELFFPYTADCICITIGPSSQNE